MILTVVKEEKQKEDDYVLIAMIEKL